MSVIRYVLRHVVESVVFAYKMRVVHLTYVTHHAKAGIEMDETWAKELWDDYLYNIAQLDPDAISNFYTDYMVPADIQAHGDRMHTITVVKQCAAADREYRMAVNAARVAVKTNLTRFTEINN